MARVMTGKKLKETRFWYIMSELNTESCSQMEQGILGGINPPDIGSAQGETG